MTSTPCEWCGNATTGRSATCGSAHRGARWRWLKAISTDPPPWPSSPLHGRYGELAAVRPAQPQAVPQPAVELALQAVTSASVAQVRTLQRERNAAAARADRLLTRATDAEAARRSNGPRAGSRARSGVTISYSKAVKAMQDSFAAYVMASGCTETEARAEIERALRAALPPVQRQKLEARDA